MKLQQLNSNSQMQIVDVEEESENGEETRNKPNKLIKHET
jgi:hypothetical protein